MDEPTLSGDVSQPTIQPIDITPEISSVPESPQKKKGFASHPENINRKGRPPKGVSLTEVMKEFLNMPVSGVSIFTLDGQQNPEARRLRNEALVEKVYELAAAGDFNCLKLIWQYSEGMPAQKVDMTVEKVEHPLAAAISALIKAPNIIEVEAEEDEDKEPV